MPLCWCLRKKRRLIGHGYLYLSKHNLKPTCHSLPQDSQGLSGPVSSLAAPLHWQSGHGIQSILWHQSPRPLLCSLPGCVLHTDLQAQRHSGGQSEERSVHVEFKSTEIKFLFIFFIFFSLIYQKMHAQTMTTFKQFKIHLDILRVFKSKL